MLPYHICHIYRTWRTYRLVKILKFEVLIWEGGGKPKMDGTIFMREVDPSRHQVKILIWQL